MATSRFYGETDHIGSATCEGGIADPLPLLTASGHDRKTTSTDDGIKGNPRIGFSADGKKLAQEPGSGELQDEDVRALCMGRVSSVFMCR